MSEIFMIITDKCPNHNTGIMGRITYLVGEEYPVPTKGYLRLNSIVEGLGKNGKPCIVMVYDKDVIVELPDYGIDKYRKYEIEQGAK